MNIGIFSGSFNPVHNGHVALAAHLARHAGLDQIWMLVSPLNPLKRGREQASAKARYEMLELALSDTPGLRASDYELSLPSPTYTCNTLKSLSADYPEHRFALIIGADNMEVFQNWRNWQFILDNYRIIVYPRPGSDIEHLKQIYRDKMEVVTAPEFDISSTMIRDKVMAGEDISGLVHPDVEQYIKSHGLYQK